MNKFNECHTLKDYKKLKIQLEDSIMNMICQFEEITQTEISGVEILYDFDEDQDTVKRFIKVSVV